MKEIDLYVLPRIWFRLLVLVFICKATVRDAMIDSSGSGAQDIGLPDPVSPPQMRLFSEQCSQIQIQIQKCTNTQEVGACQQHSHRSVLIEGRTQVQKYRSSLFHLPPVVSPIRAQGRLGKIWRAPSSCDFAAPSPPPPTLPLPLHPFQLLANFARNRLETHSQVPQLTQEGRGT